MKPVLVILGTRPEAIKLWPVIEELKRRDVPFRVVSTEQQPDLLLPLLDELKIHVHHYAATQLPANTLTEKLSKYICSLGWMIGHDIGASLVIVQGDTTTALAGALAAFYAGVPVAHVEAGLRTYDLAAPFPEEGNRQMISRIASLHFCPTNENRHTIIDELAVSSGEDGAVYAVGNTVVDAVKRIMVEELLESGPPGRLDILVTFHRRESWAEAAQVARAIAGLSHRYDVLWVQHANKHLRGVIEEAIFVMRFEGHDTDPPPFIRFVEPMGYRPFLRALCQAELVITDSGGVVEECTTLGKPCLMLRNATERTEALDAGHRLLSVDELDRLPALVDELYASSKVKPSDAFGDGHAAGRIVAHIQDFLELRGT